MILLNFISGSGKHNTVVVGMHFMRFILVWLYVHFVIAPKGRLENSPLSVLEDLSQLSAAATQYTQR